MEQKLFSKLIIEFIERNYPEFIKTIKHQDDGSFDCDLKSDSGFFSIWIATYNSEITIGIEDPTGQNNIHTHISCYEIEDLKSCTTELSKYIENIKANKLILYKDKDGKYDWIESSEFKNQDGSKKFSWKK